MFVTTSICAASRATILTGLYERTHQFTFRTRPIDSRFSQASYPVLLRKAGYKTGFIGKFGVNVQQQDREAMFDSSSRSAARLFQKQPDGSLRQERAGRRPGDRVYRPTQGQRPVLSLGEFNAAHAEDGDKRPGIGHFPWPKAVDGLYEDVPIKAPRLSDPKIFESHPSS